MVNLKLLRIILIFITIGLVKSEQVEDDEQTIEVGENRIAAQIFAILDHFKQDDPIGIPGAPLPDPMPVPDIRKSLTFSTLNMKNIKAHAVSKFRIKSVKTDLRDLKVNAGVQLDALIVKGTYTLTAPFTPQSTGPFSIVLKNVFVTGNASLGVERDGKLHTQDIIMDITFSDMSMDFQNLGFFGAIFQGIVNSAPTLVFDTMKPYILADAYRKLRKDIDENLDNVLGTQRLSNSVAPLDMAIAEARKKVRSLGYDPFILPDYNRTVGLFQMELRNTWILGLSSFYRVGDMTITMENNTVAAKFQVGTQKIDGSTQWKVSLGKRMLSTAGAAQFTVQHIKITLEISQPLDTRKRPILNDIQFNVGNIQARMDGAGTLDYIIEFAINVLPNLLRYQIMDALSGPIKQRLQESLNQINVENQIKENLRNIEKLGGNFDNFKM